MDKEAEQFLMHGFIDPEPKRPWLAQRMALRIPYSAQKLLETLPESIDTMTYEFDV